MKKKLMGAILMLSMAFLPMQEVRAENQSSNGLDGVGVYEQNVQSGVQGMYVEGYTETQVDQANRNGALAVGELFQGAGVTGESAGQANTFLYPIAKGVNVIASFILGFTSLGIFLVTALDLLYIAFPPVRNMLMGEEGGTRWISDEALACAGGSQGGKGQGNQMGGSPMGGSPKEEKKKGVITSYLKKRTVFLVVFAITTILFTSTVFTDLGIRVGMLVLGWITGMTGSIPV